MRTKLTQTRVDPGVADGSKTGDLITIHMQLQSNCEDVRMVESDVYYFYLTDRPNDYLRPKKFMHARCLMEGIPLANEIVH